MAKRLAAGRLRHQIDIQTNMGEGTLDAFGQNSTGVEYWKTEVSCRADIESLGGNEALVVQQMYPTARYKVSIDYTDVLESTGGARRRVLFNGRHMEIISIANLDKENFVHELICAQGDE